MFDQAKNRVDYTFALPHAEIDGKDCENRIHVSVPMVVGHK